MHSFPKSVDTIVVGHHLIFVSRRSFLQESKSNFQTFCYSACLEQSNLTKIQKNVHNLEAHTVIKHWHVKRRSSEKSQKNNA